MGGMFRASAWEKEVSSVRGGMYMPPLTGLDKFNRADTINMPPLRGSSDIL